MKLDTHVHTFHSGNASVFPFNHFMRESYNTPESVYDTLIVIQMGKPKPKVIHARYGAATP